MQKVGRNPGHGLASWLPSCSEVILRDFLVIQGWTLSFSTRGAGHNPDQARSYMPLSQKAGNMNQKQCCNRFNKGFKMIHIKKKKNLFKKC